MSDYFHKHKTSLIICLLVGFVIALATRASFFEFSTQFKYLKLGTHVYSAPTIPFDKTNLGKTIIGRPGFPFSTYSQCVVGWHGELPSPACEKVSWVWESSIILNTLFWAGIACGLNWWFKKIAEIFRKSV
jgi:hypothetical protein